MNKPLKFVALSFAVALAAVTSAASEPIKVGIAAEPYPPFTSPDAQGNWVGWEIDFEKAVCAEAKLDCMITPVSWDGIIPALMSKKIDLIIASMSITDERLKTIDFSDKYYNTPSAVIGTKGVDFTATPEGLAGKTIGVAVSTIQQVYATKYFGSAGATVREYQTQDEANQDLASGRIDAVQADSIALDAFLKTEVGKACCDLKGLVKDDPSILGAGIGVGIRKGDADLKAKINAAIKAIRANGTYAAFSKTYFDFDVYGN
ncbi:MULTISPECIES: transporter substrate-binding domain-containing protein [Rhizobium/Agrobacterium group]|uniref:transporter substrate-binding domain-containing protein n=1 Tax=Rhizobium/Agrobacterium group TaxID=227290 RepID=UPI001ADA83C9|nr:MULTISPECIES: transporter substrate-binding domain-containing protein [Rhizobium/Agrobacterium group]MBO9112438.1 transporter substrate-binding domain-containing protein [Agrobacterium sp. S2/73]QXZ75946.1 transporter substrate-binding domain-containing protein [Agrobacterium sp. S7/73]QYA17043.1 transporter substrate-binding domain-containing protein [Rhizobium sp. AB2/73]UEQ85384.1 transporter substrate-binding domain-containing protein [Rhizobium sp. AB2/73]